MREKLHQISRILIPLHPTRAMIRGNGLPVHSVSGHLKNTS